MVASAIMVGIVYTIIRPPPDATFLYILQGVLALYPAAWLAWLVAARPRLVVQSWGLDVTSRFFRYRIPWITIQRI